MRRTTGMLLCWAGHVVACAHAPAPAGPHIRFDQSSPLGRVLVVDEQGKRYLRFSSLDGDDQSVITLDDADAVPLEYIRGAALALAFVPKPRRALMIGLGGGTFTSLLRRSYPHLRIDVVELDPVVVEAAKLFFQVREDDRFSIHIEDGADFVAQSGNSYDIIFLDAYEAQSMPGHLTTAAHFADLRARLSPRGVVVLNLGLETRSEKEIARRFRGVFASSTCLRTPVDQNLLLFGLKERKLPGRGELAASARVLAKALGLTFDLEALAARAGDGCACGAVF